MMPISDKFVALTLEQSQKISGGSEPFEDALNKGRQKRTMGDT